MVGINMKQYYVVQCFVEANAKNDDEAIAMIADACKLYGLTFIGWRSVTLNKKKRESNATS
jgi:glutamate synthase domain-containing protein 1